MWYEVATLLLGLLGICVGAGMFAQRRTRRAASLKALSDLFEVAPSGPAKQALRAYIDERVIEYVDGLREADKSPFKGSMALGIAVCCVGALTALIGLTLDIVGSGPAAAIGAYAWVGGVITVSAGELVVLAFVLAASMRWLSVKVRPIVG